LAAIHRKADYLLTGDVRHFEDIYGKRMEGVLVLRRAIFRAPATGLEGPPSRYIKRLCDSSTGSRDTVRKKCDGRVGADTGRVMGPLRGFSLLAGGEGLAVYRSPLVKFRGII
jgi:hypothetical protein